MSRRAGAATRVPAVQSAPRGQAAPPRPLASVVLPAAIRDAIVAYARAEAPNEMCGLIVGSATPADGGLALRWEPARNAAASPLRFDVAPDDLVRLVLEIDRRGEVVWAVAHSHVRSPAVPSAADVAGTPDADALLVVVSLAPGDEGPATVEPSLRAWRIADGSVVEVGLETT